MKKKIHLYNILRIKQNLLIFYVHFALFYLMNVIDRKLYKLIL